MDLPTYDDLASVPPGALFGLLAAGAADVLGGTYETALQKDFALADVVDAALVAAAAGTRAPAAAKPRWLDGFVAGQLSVASTRLHSRERFVRVRLLERLELVDVEPDDTYVLAMVSALGPDKPAKLRADPDLIERALWRVFEVEGGGEVSLKNVDRFGHAGWRTTFVELTSDGTLDRGRVLSECLQALGRDFLAYRAGWYSATYLALEPTVDEDASAQADLRRLLSASVPATVTFALKQLTRVQKGGLLDVRETIEALPPATLVNAKGTVLAALKLADAGRAECPEAVGAVADAALGHPNADVQRAAAKLLADLGNAAAVDAAADDLTPSVRHELGFDPVAATEASAPAGQQLTPVAPLVTGLDLAERAAALLEDASDVAELEAVLAFLATADADAALAALTPLRKRAKAVVARGSRIDFGDAWLPGQVARLVLDVLGDPTSPADPGHHALRFIARRISEVRTSTAPLLATPDLPGGWVSPAVLVERLALNPEPRHHDLIAALLRLHPDGREAAAAATGLPDAVRFALDGVEPERRFLRGGRKRPAAWWIAAERSRSTYAAAEAPHATGEIKANTWQENGRERHFRFVQFSVTTSTQRPADDRPTELEPKTYNWWSGLGVGRLGDWIPTLAAMWPHDAEHFLALSCLPVLEAGAGVEHDVSRVLDALARHPGRMGSLAAATVAAGISATQRDHRLHAVDAFLDLVASSRVPVSEVAAVMARYAEAWPATRWAESLTSVTQAPGGSQMTVDLLTHLLPQLATSHRGVNKLLDLLRNELLRLGQTVTDPDLIRWLGEFTGSSAAAKTARELRG